MQSTLKIFGFKNIRPYFATCNFYSTALVSRKSPIHLHKTTTKTTHLLLQEPWLQMSKLNLKNKIRFLSHYEGMPVTDVAVPVPWGHIKVQIFGDLSNKNAKPMLSVHGYLDNSNSFKPLAPYLHGDAYYIISIDLPGHGLSSGLPQGIPYTPKLYLNSIRRVVKYFELEKFIFLAHSYGTMMALLYDTVFQNELNAIIGIDWIFGYTSSNWISYSHYWKEGIDGYLEIEKSKVVPKVVARGINSSVQTPTAIDSKPKEPMNFDKAVEILMKANHHLDENSAKILMERASNLDDNGKLKFSRDINAKISMGYRDHYAEFVTLLPEVKKNLAAPTLMIHAKTPSYGQASFDNTLNTLRIISDESRVKIKTSVIDGTHHFHMIKPKETAQVIFEFLNKLQTSPSTKL